MPVIPRFQDIRGIESPRMSPSIAGSAEEALVRAGGQITGTADYLFKVNEFVQEKKKTAARHVKISQARIALRKYEQEFAEGFKNRTEGYDKFEEEATTQLEQKRLEMEKAFENDPEGLQAFNDLFSGRQRVLMDIVRARSTKVMVDQGEAATDQISLNQLEDYAAEPAAAKRKIIVKNHDEFLQDMYESGIINDVDRGNRSRAFIASAELERADKMIDVAPNVAEEMLKDGDFDLDPANIRKKIEDAQREQRRLETQERIVETAAKTKTKEAKKFAHDTEEREIADVLFIENDPVRASIMLGRSNLTGDEIAVWTERIKKVAKGEKPEDPFKRSNDKYTDELFEDARQGFIAPETLRPIPNKLSREDYRLAKSIAEFANKPDKKYIMDLTKSVIREGTNIILGTDWMYFDKPEISIKDKGTMERFIYRELVNAETDEAKLDLLDENSKNFVLRRALQSVGRTYDPDKPEEEFAPMFRPSGGSTVKTPSGSTEPRRRLWGEK